MNIGINSQQAYDAEMSGDGTVVSGLQDNGEMKMTPDGHLYEIFGGDAFFNTIDPNHSNNILEEYTYGNTSVTLDGGTTWYNIASGDCSSSSALFSTPIEQDPTMPGHVVVGCNPVDEAANVYTNPCADPTCSLVNLPWTSDYTIPSLQGSVTSIPSAVGVRGANVYVGYCGYCDTVTGGTPFKSGIATNVGANQPPQIGSPNSWHVASAFCGNCQTSSGHLPQRYITSIQIDPSDPNIVYVTMGGYGRRWVAPGSLGETTDLGVGHIFKSTDHGEHFMDISGNLPDAPADWTLVHAGDLVVSTDVGVFIDPGTNGGTWNALGSGLPKAPVFTIRLSPSNPNVLLASTYGRGNWTFTFAASAPTPSVPNTGAAGSPGAAVTLLVLMGLGAASALSPRRRGQRLRRG